MLYIIVSFIPEFSRFAIDGYNDDFIAYMEKQAIDASMVTGITVVFNEKAYAISSLKEYTNLYIQTNECLYLNSQKDNCSSEAIVLPSDEPLEIGFVNGIPVNSGIHIRTWQKKIFDHIIARLAKSDIKIKITELKNRTAIFVKCVVVNPTFTSQSKEKLEKPTPYVKVEDDDVKGIMKWKIIEDIKKAVEDKSVLVLNKRKQRVVIHELEDANHIKKADLTLIFCEGDLAKTFVVSGLKYGLLGLKGRAYCGIFTLRGKFCNVRRASKKQLIKNAMVKKIIDAVGLELNKDYSEDIKSLRYKKIVVIADADADGIHINGLMLNMMEYLFPTLFKHDFIYFMRTPIVRITAEPMFYIQDQARKYFTENNVAKNNVKYLKGLGSSNKDEIKDVLVKG